MSYWPEPELLTEQWTCPMCGFVATQVREIQTAGAAGVYAEICAGCRGVAWSESGQPPRAMTESDLQRCSSADRRALARAVAEAEALR